MGGTTFLRGFVKMRKWRIIKDTPRSKIRSMAMGIVEIHGSVVAEKTIKTPFARTDCVYYKWEVKEYRKSSSSSKSSSSHYRWVSIGSGEKSVPFYATDDTGRVWVDPDGADFEVECKKVYYQEGKGFFSSFAAVASRIKALDFLNRNNLERFVSDAESCVLVEGSPGLRGTSVGDRKYLEHYIESGDNLFVIGTAANDPKAPDNVLIRKGRNEKAFMISDRPEKGLLKKLKKTMIISFIIGGICFVIGLVLLLQKVGII